MCMLMQDFMTHKSRDSRLQAVCVEYLVKSIVLALPKGVGTSASVILWCQCWCNSLMNISLIYPLHPPIIFLSFNKIFQTSQCITVFWCINRSSHTRIKIAKFQALWWPRGLRHWPWTATSSVQVQLGIFVACCLSSLCPHFLSTVSHIIKA